jgi:hypothetical protein
MLEEKVKNLVKILEDKHPDCELIDIKFSLDHSKIDPNIDICKFVDDMSEAIKNAEEIDIYSVFGNCIE